jgi:alkylation response protein AidB-like acyl-CoA dehydrogenase
VVAAEAHVEAAGLAPPDGLAVGGQHADVGQALAQAVADLAQPAGGDDVGHAQDGGPLAEAARERALAIVRKRRSDEHLLQAVGEMENQLEAARATHAQWVAFGKDAEPGPATSSKSMVYRTLLARSVLGTVDAAMDVAGGASFFRANGLERLFRDAQGARYHPLQEGLQKALAARVALGLDIDAR